MGNCCTNSRQEDDLRQTNGSNGTNNLNDPKYKKNVFKQPQGQEYVVESRESLAQAAKYNTQQILEQKSKQELEAKADPQEDQTHQQRQSVDFFQSGKFTFEPNGKQPLHQAAGNEIIDSGVSFGMANQLLSQQQHISFAGDNDGKNYKDKSHSIYSTNHIKEVVEEEQNEQ